MDSGCKHDLRSPWDCRGKKTGETVKPHPTEFLTRARHKHNQDTSELDEEQITFQYT